MIGGPLGRPCSHEIDRVAESTAGPILARPQAMERSPSVLHGSVEECAEKLLESRERFGINYVHLGSNVDAVAPLVARLS